MKRPFVFRRQDDLGFSFGVEPIWIHKHSEYTRFHFHMIFNLGFWYLEITIGRSD